MLGLLVAAGNEGVGRVTPVALVTDPHVGDDHITWPYSPLAGHGDRSADQTRPISGQQIARKLDRGSGLGLSADVGSGVDIDLARARDGAVPDGRLRRERKLICPRDAAALVEVL